MVELLLTELQAKILKDLLEGIPGYLIAYERKCSRSNISQIKKTILQHYPALQKKIKMANKKYVKVNVDLD